MIVIATVKKKKNYGVVNSLGKLAVPVKYYGALYAGEDLFAVLDSDLGWGYMNPKKELVVPFGYDSIDVKTSRVNIYQAQYAYALYPVWILNTQWNGQKFTFGINGQTGKIAGDLPMDKSKFWTWLVGVSGAVTAAAFAISYLMWL